MDVYISTGAYNLTDWGFLVDRIFSPLLSHSLTVNIGFGWCHIGWLFGFSCEMVWIENRKSKKMSVHEKWVARRAPHRIHNIDISWKFRNWIHNYGLLHYRHTKLLWIISEEDDECKIRVPKWSQSKLLMNWKVQGKCCWETSTCFEIFHSIWWMNLLTGHWIEIC